jgi:hypothetical protein
VRPAVRAGEEIEKQWAELINLDDLETLRNLLHRRLAESARQTPLQPIVEVDR